MSELLAQLLGQHRQKVLAFFSRRVDREAAEDLTQEVLLRIHRSWNSFDASRGDFGAWSLAIARNVLTDFFAKGARPIEQTSQIEESLLPEEGPGQDDTIEKKIIQEEILSAISRLPEPERTVVSNRELLGMKLSETAESLNLSIRTVSRKLLSAYELLRTDLTQRGIHPGAVHD